VTAGQEIVSQQRDQRIKKIERERERERERECESFLTIEVIDVKEDNMSSSII
jgi:hypothetical protein